MKENLIVFCNSVRFVSENSYMIEIGRAPVLIALPAVTRLTVHRGLLVPFFVPYKFCSYPIGSLSKNSNLDGPTLFSYGGCVCFFKVSFLSPIGFVHTLLESNIDPFFTPHLPKFPPMATWYMDSIKYNVS